jgi:iron only hydrogenase large subunit-like protein
VKHVTIMPCYDKKLESVRPEFSDPLTMVKEVDTVLATHEMLALFKDKSIDFKSIVEAKSQDEEFVKRIKMTRIEA